MPLDQFARLPRDLRAQIVDGLAGAIDGVADGAPASHRFLRYQWYAAALEAYGGSARTLTVLEEDRPVLAVPMVAIGPRALRAAAVPGSYWPFRSIPVASDAGIEAAEAALDLLARHVNALRIGPVYERDRGVGMLIEAAKARGWQVVGRTVADSFMLDMKAAREDGVWPRNSTLRKNRFHEKHLADHGTLNWSFESGGDWPGVFDDLAEIERASWIAVETDGTDAKFTSGGHGAFWRAATRDPVIAGMCRAAMLRIDGKPAAFSFDIDAGELKYAIANSYDPAFAKHSPGKLLYYRNLLDGLSRGITTVDWGAGDSGYKRVIGATPGPAIRDWLLLKPGLPAALAPLVRRAWRGR